MTLNPTLLTPTLLKPPPPPPQLLFVYLTLTDPNPNPSKAPKQRALRVDSVDSERASKALQGLGGTLVLLGSEGRLQGLVYVLGGQITIPPLILQTLLYTFTLAIAAATLGLCAGTKEEEDLLAKEFGDEWKEYVRKVPYKLVPYVY
ncbi:hypothetical protein CC2G_004870 [Coprinopsis cinerea AmutBmut pab1-1]|nr:hypothetical protein CC2G_004870 [Coprinopsis cinerea AmutBmut pab1-1]